MQPSLFIFSFRPLLAWARGASCKPPALLHKNAVTHSTPPVNLHSLVPICC